MADLVLSPSSIDAFRTCGWRWFLEYVEAAPQNSSVAQSVGLAVHAGVEEYYLLRLEGLTHEEVGDTAAIDAYEMTLALSLLQVGEPEEDLVKARGSGKRSLMVYLEDVAPDVDPDYVEQEIRLNVNGVELSMHPDLIATGIVHDTKIKRAKPRDPGVYALQMNIGALGFRALTGEKERDVRLDIIIRLKRDRPRYVPISNGGPVTDYAMGKTVRQIEWTADQINRGLYPPTGLETGACRWCPVSHACAYYEEMTRAQ